jgi:hypothetical protein
MRSGMGYRMSPMGLSDTVAPSDPTVAVGFYWNWGGEGGGRGGREGGREREGESVCWGGRESGKGRQLHWRQCVVGSPSFLIGCPELTAGIFLRQIGNCDQDIFKIYRKNISRCFILG